MRIKCQCGRPAVISKSEIISKESTELYCSCTDASCGHSFVTEVAYKHTLSKQWLGGYAVGGRVYCGCGSKAIITKTNRLSTNVADLYCRCTACEHRFVMSQAFSFSLSPSAKTTDELAMALVRSLSPSRRNELRQQLSLF